MSEPIVTRVDMGLGPDWEVVSKGEYDVLATDCDRYRDAAIKAGDAISRGEFTLARSILHHALGSHRVSEGVTDD